MGPLIPADDEDTNIQGRFDAWFDSLKEIQGVLGNVPITEGSKTIRLWKTENEQMKARVQKFDDDAQQAVTQAAGGVATTGETLNLLKTENLTIATELVTCQKDSGLSQQECQIQPRKIIELDDMRISLQAILSSSDDRIGQLQKELSRGQSGIQTVDVEERVSVLFDRLQDLVRDFPRSRVREEVMDQISTVILNAFPSPE